MTPPAVGAPQARQIHILDDILGDARGLPGPAGPTLAMADNARVGPVADSFVRLTQRMNHAGSAYALVGATVGPRAGFFACFAMLRA